MAYIFIFMPLRRHFNYWFPQINHSILYDDNSTNIFFQLSKGIGGTGGTKCSASRSPYLGLFMISQKTLWFVFIRLPYWLNIYTGGIFLIWLTLGPSLTSSSSFTTHYGTPYTIMIQKRSLPVPNINQQLVQSLEVLLSHEVVHK